MDQGQRQTAYHMSKRNPRWLVLWGVYSRQYWAFPLFRAPTRAIVHCTDEDTLLAAMRETELAVTAGRS